MDVRIEEWVPSGPDDLARAVYALGLVRQDEESPEDPVAPLETWFDQIVVLPSFRRPLRWVARPAGPDDGDEVVATAYLERTYLEENRHLSGFDLYVRPDLRRHGIGRRLLAAVVEAARADGRTSLGSTAISDGPAEPFLRAVGMEAKATERKSRLIVADVDRRMLEEWVARAEERASEYELIGYDDRCPDEWVEKWIGVELVMNTAPRDDFEMEDETDTPERYREREEKALARGMRWWRLIALHKPTGHFAGFTDLAFPPYSNEAVWQMGTAVDPAHRDKGLGRWLKAANLLRLMDERPAAKHVDTWNAFSNGPMLGINIAMGFEIVRGYTAYQASTDDLAKRL